MSTPKLPEILEKMADVVLAHRLKPKTAATKKRARSSAAKSNKNQKKKKKSDKQMGGSG